MPSARAATSRSTPSSSGVGAESPGCQKLVTPTAPKPGLTQLVERRPRVSDDVVDGAHDEAVVWTNRRRNPTSESATRTVMVTPRTGLR